MASRRSATPLQQAAEAILPPTLAQKEEVGADPIGRPENVPPAVLANRAALALGGGGLKVFSKLGIRSRRELATALPADSELVPA